MWYKSKSVQLPLKSHHHPLLPGWTAGPTHSGDCTFISHGNTPAAVWTCREVASSHGAEKSPHQTLWTSEPGHQHSAAEEQHRRAAKPHRCWRLLQRGLSLWQREDITVYVFVIDGHWAVVVALSQVSQISSVFDCLLEEEERSLKESPVDSVQWAEVVLTVNNIIKVNVLCCFLLYLLRSH